MSTWNAKAKKIVGCVAAVTVLCGSSALAYAAGAGMNASDKTKTEPTAQTTAAADETPAPQTKDETVYVLAGADGAVKKVIVSDWVKNTAGASQITDESDVNDPQNVKSDAGYTLSQDGLRVWDAQGQDIYYQGTVDKELPVTLSVKYTLDGAAISPADLAGKSGKVTMRFDYENRQSETVTIDGKPTKIYVPFVMMTGMILDNDVFRNVTVSNGKLINDGDRSVVMGFAMPGMQENLALDKDKVDIPNYVEITADVTNFELTTTLTLATNELFNEVDTDKFDSLDELTAKMDDLTDAMNRLMDGSSKLYTNLKTLTEKSRTLVSSIDQLAEGAGQLADGAKTVADGAKTVADGAKTVADGVQTASDGAKTVADGSAQIYTNMATLSAGLQTLTSSSADLTDGAKRVFDTLLTTANAQIKAAGLDVPELTIDSYAATLDQVIASLDEASVRALAEKTARETVTAKVNEQEAVIRDKVTEAVRAQVLSGVLAKAMNGMTIERYQQAVAAGMVDEATQAQINGAVDQQMQTAEMQAAVQQNVEAQKTQLIEQAMAGDEVKGQIEQAVAKAAAGVQQLTALKEQLNSYNTFYQGVLAYTAGTGTAADGAQQLTDGAKQLSDGAKQLSDGSTQLSDGTKQLSDGSAQLSDGTKQLSGSAATLAGYLNELRDQSAALPDGAQQLTDGAMQLSDGLKELNEQGVKKLADAVNGDLNGLLTRVRATVDVSKDYDNFAGKATGTDGTVRFIYRTDSIEAAS